MAQGQLLHCQSSYNDLCDLRQDFSQPQPGLDYTNHFDPTFANPTAQAMLQRQYRPESGMPSSTWGFPDTMSREQMPPVATPSGSAPNNGFSSPIHFWEGGPTFGSNAVAWSNAPSMQPIGTSQPEYHYLRNSGLSYNDNAAQAPMVKAGDTYGGHKNWSAPRSNAVMRAADLDTNESHSPGSYLEGNLESPSSMLDQATPGDDWNRYSPTFPYVKESASGAASPELHKTEGFGEAEFAGLPQLGMSKAMPAGPYRQAGQWVGSYENTREARSVYSYPHGSGPDASPWYHSEFSLDAAGLPLMTRDARMDQARSDNSSNASFPQLAPQQIASRSDSRVGVPSRGRYQPRFQVPDAQALHRVHNDILLQGRADGETYKEILRRMPGKTPAESTLRGRYRSLIKARENRLRKPVWKERDIELLNEFVDLEFDRVEHAHGRALGVDQKLRKVQWKRVADYIVAQGGSYHFGNSTCKKKWVEINLDS
ncbi:hypothetical protein N0V83_003009 [Neocucurbitaria cava]|uniref:Myb-like domain-containing protein n=1 Tax=Neocucurbitaria cava TaxID=798079 RepID=A0A9W9CQ24_9PLEO|nr:hypothetical protein N0V83_003009 [Neocucurbitaria cava]